MLDTLKAPAPITDCQDMQAPPIADLRATFAGLASELVLCIAGAGAFFAVAPGLSSAGPDAKFVWLMAVVLHALASLRFAENAAAFINLDCPTCSYSFHGFPEHLPRPSRRCCAHCGSELA
ncbi:MAG: hypothetical protein JRH16_07215 [Deltaproteobacteria bacterium]|nr:hypothetical protein [Deltaproteobacteria bacterium]MBW2359992.1 hypothetical protein [Deltaproteobacteria bacterium]